jgi:hypothetical protein
MLVARFWPQAVYYELQPRHKSTDARVGVIITKDRPGPSSPRVGIRPGSNSDLGILAQTLVESIHLVNLKERRSSISISMDWER